MVMVEIVEAFSVFSDENCGLSDEEFAFRSLHTQAFLWTSARSVAPESFSLSQTVRIVRPNKTN